MSPETRNLRLRFAKPGDIETLYQLDRLCFDSEFRFSRAAMRSFVQAPGAFTLLAEFPSQHTPALDSAMLAGFLIIQITALRNRLQAYIVTLDVDPEHRRQGVARQLLQAAELEASRQGASSLTLHVWTGNEPAMHFYDRSAFVRTTLHTDFYAPSMHAWGYSKPLLAKAEA